MKALQIFLISLILTTQVITAQTEKVVTGFYPVYRTLPNNYDYSRLTHLMYFSIIPKGDGSFSWTSGRDSVTMYNTFQDLKSKLGTTGTKLILCVGGTSEVGSGGFNEIAADPSITDIFVGRLKAMLDLWGADGVDIDWEKWLKTKADSDNHEAFMKALHDALKPAGYLIFTDVSASNWNGQWFNTKAADYVDFIQPMAYTFSGSWSATSAPNSAYNESIGALEYWVGRGVPKEKLVLGVPFYGMGFGGSDQPGTAFSGGSSLGTYVNYPDILNAIESGDYNHSVEGDPKGPYIYRSGSNAEIIFYNDTTIMGKKMDFINDSGYAGAMIWELGQDKEGPMSLLNLMAERLLDWDGGTVENLSFNSNLSTSHLSVNITHQKLNIFSSEYRSITIKLFNAKGRLIKSIEKKNIHKGKTSISLKDLTSGYYFGSIKSEKNNISVHPFIIQ